MNFSADQYLMISDRIVEKAVRCLGGHGPIVDESEPALAPRGSPPTSEMLTRSEIARLRRNSEVAAVQAHRRRVMQRARTLVQNSLLVGTGRAGIFLQGSGNFSDDIALFAPAHLVLSARSAFTLPMAADPISRL
jgi:hypothetical protein